MNPSKPQASTPQYGLQCPTCDRITPYEHLDVRCHWCGTSLAAARSRVLPSPEKIRSTS